MIQPQTAKFCGGETKNFHRPPKSERAPNEVLSGGTANLATLLLLFELVKQLGPSDENKPIFSELEPVSSPDTSSFSLYRAEPVYTTYQPALEKKILYFKTSLTLHLPLYSPCSKIIKLCIF